MAGKYSKTNNHSNLNSTDGPDGHEETDDQAYSKPSAFLNERESPGAVNTLHRWSDLDSSQLAQHHTLGTSHNQSASGDHNHNGTNSKPLFWTFSGSGTTNSVGTLIINTNAPFNTVSAAFVEYDQTLRGGGPYSTAVYYDTWTPTNHSIGTQWYNGTSVVASGTVYYRGVVFP